MFDLSDYIRLIAGLVFLLASFFNYIQYRKNPEEHKNGRLAAILLFVAGILYLSSVALAYFYGT
jgi:hypothetical protein